MSKLGLTPEEEIKLKTICEYLFFDEYTDYASYTRFEQCFQPLFNNIKISIDKVFKTIVGNKKKYINYPRFVNAYLQSKSTNPPPDPDLATFFNILFNSILRKENTNVGKPQEKTFNFCTPKACKRRDCLSEVKILNDKEGSIQGLILEYDNTVQNKMYPSKIEQNLVISLEMKLGIIDEKLRTDLNKLGGVREEFLKDAVTHVFGTFNEKTGVISFLGFKCVSGKTVFVGYPQGNSFLFGKFGTKFHEVKLHNNLTGINFFQPGFNTNIKTNLYLNAKTNDISKEDLTKETFIQDEVQLSQLTDDVQIDKMITTPIIDENHFLDEKLLDDISGNDYKEVVNQAPRDWILKLPEKEKKEETKAILTVEDALKEVEKEKEKSKELLNTEIGELMAKGLKRGKSKKNNKKKKQRGKNGKLHETKNLVSNKKRQINKWDGASEITKNFKPMDFIRSKENYKKLKYHLTKGFYNEISKIDTNFENDKVAQDIMNDIMPNPEASLEKRTNKSVKQKRASRKNKEKEKEKVEVKKQEKKQQKIIRKNMKGETKEFIRGEKKQRSKSVQKPIAEQEIPVEISGDKKTYNKYFCSDAQILAKTIEKIKDNTGDGKLRATKGAEPEEKWHIFSRKIKLLSGNFLLQTIRAVLKAIKAINDEIDGKKILSLEERAELFQVLDENENIVDFLNQDTEGANDQEEGEKKEEEDDMIEPEEDLMIPSEHPEKITNLKELETKMEDINKLLAKKDLKDEDRKKLEKLKSLYLQQKNILIENKTEIAKNEIINQNNIDINKYLEEEKKRRAQAQEEAQKKVEEEIKKEKSQAKSETSISQGKLPQGTKIFRNQEFYTGSEPWEDPLFKPEQKNICPLDRKGKWILPPDGLDSDVKDWRGVGWCRVEELFYSENYCIFSNGIAIEDIVQGDLGNCYFLSAIGALCKYPKLLENLFLFKEKTKENMYGIYFYINGLKKLVLIDDYLPCISEQGYKRFIMGKSEENEIWVSLIEKAFAKINGGYIRIGTGGTPNEVFDVLTEAYSEEIRVTPKKEDELWKKLINGFEKKYLMTAGTSGNEFVEEVGLSPGHAYTVLGIHEINGERVIRLRNPWGSGEFSGDWSDYSSKWNEDLKKKYNYYEKDDGDFFMGFKDFLIYFIKMGIAKFHLSWSSTKLKIKKSEATKCQLIKITIPQDDILVYFQLYSKNPRIPYKNGEYPNPVLSNLILVDKDFNYIDSTKDNQMQICVEATLKKGEYYLFADSNFRYTTQGPHGFTITAYSSIDIPLENVTEKKNVAELLRKTMIDFAKKNLKAFPQKNGVDYYGNEAFKEKLPFKLIVLDNKSDKNIGVKTELIYKGSKSCSFYCDDIANEKDNILVKNLNSKETICIMIMYHSISSLFEHKLTFIEPQEQQDKDYYHEVFNEEPEELNESGTLKDYYLSTDDSIFIGIESSINEKVKLKLILEGMKISSGEYKDKTEVIFELNEKGRKVFEVVATTDDENLSFLFEFA